MKHIADQKLRLVLILSIEAGGQRSEKPSEPSRLNKPEGMEVREQSYGIYHPTTGPSRFEALFGQRKLGEAVRRDSGRL